MGRLNIDETVKDIKDIMHVIGTWPEQYPSTAYKLLGFLTVSITAVIIATTLVQVFNNFRDIESVAFGICSSMAGFHNIVKYMIVSYNKSKFYKILDSLKDPILAEHEDHLDIYLNRKIRLCSIFRPMFFIAAVGTGLIAIASPIFDTKSKLPLPMPFPMNLEERPLSLYYVIWCLQGVAILLTCWNIPCLDGLIFTFMAIAGGLLKILRERIICAANGSSSSLHHLQIKANKTTITNNLLKECVRMHLAIERYIAAIEETFTFGFLIQMIISLLIICLIGFNFVLLPVSSLEFGRCFLFFCAVLIELMFFCIPANEISLQSEKIGEACYMSKWSDCDPLVRKTLFIIMERSKRPFYLTAATFTKLSLETFVSILKSAFSYFTVLIQLYSRSHDE